MLKQLGMVATGTTEESPDSPYSTFKVNLDWRIIWINEYACPFLDTKYLTKLSRDTEIILCLVEEHVMASSAELWSQGQRKWWISHEGENGPEGLETEGELPTSFSRIRADLEKKQEEAGGMSAEVDYIFDIPTAVAESIVGFKHDKVTVGTFKVLQREVPRPWGFFSKLFGR